VKVVYDKVTDRGDRRVRSWLKLATAAAILGVPQARAAEQTLRVIAHADLKVLDTTANTTYITNRYGYLVYDTLFGLNSKLEPQPQMVDTWSVSADALTWTFVLRPGQTFHDGAAVTAADCIASLKRWMVRDAMGQILASRIASFEAVDTSKFKMNLTEPYALVLETFGRWGVPPFMMPEKVASAPIAEQVTSSIGSGPFIMKRDEWRPGSKVVYIRNPNYVPRKEPPDYMAGGKVAKLDRVEWHYITDANTALSALMTGEMDYYELPPLDFIGLLKDNPEITVRIIDKLGVQQFIRPNSLFPPFDNFKARQALLYLASQEEYNQAVVGNPDLYMKFCGALFMCGSDNDTDAGAVKTPDIAKAKALLTEAGYKGEKLVVLQPTDRPPYNAATMVMVEKLRAAGVNVDLQPADWSTISIRRARKDPPDKGGWNIVITGHGGPDAANPISNYWIGSNCDKANIGWACDPKLQALISAWSHEPDRAKRRALIPALQEQAYTSVPYAPMGQFFQPIAYRKNVTGVLEAGMPVYWNVEKK
jgi:peptide/nickel transport system substrate-binding protein